MNILKTAIIATSLAFSVQAFADDGVISVQSIRQYQSVNPGSRVGELIWRGGLVLNGPEKFGGISGITFLDEKNLIMVSDRGQFISATLVHDEDGRPSGVENAVFTPIQNSSGQPLPPNYSRDSEAIETIFRQGRATAVRVGFENLTRVADFKIERLQPFGAAREIFLPDWLSEIRSNQSIESVCIAPPASPVAGSTLLLTEDVINENGAHSAYLLGRTDRGELALEVASGFNPTDCAFLPDGDLLVLERGTGFLSFTMQLRRIDAQDVKPGATMQGDIILDGFGSDIDNMEGLAVRLDPDGSTRIVIVSDDNFNGWERTLLLEFEVPG